MQTDWLFENGRMIIIIEMIDQDKFSVLCPKSWKFLENRQGFILKDVSILLKTDQYFEPIYKVYYKQSKLKKDTKFYKKDTIITKLLNEIRKCKQSINEVAYNNAIHLFLDQSRKQYLIANGKLKYNLPNLINYSIL